MAEPRYEVRSGTAGIDPTTGRRSAPERDPYRYGYRTLWGEGPDGRRQSRVVPLSYQDLLDPQLGDSMTQDSLHIQLVSLLMSLLRTHFASDPEVAVFGDLKVIFDVPGLPGPGPDIFVVRGARDRDRRRKSFRVSEEPGQIVLVIEVVSPEYKKKDYESLPEIYEKAGIGEYVTIEALGQYLTDPYKLAGHRLGEDRRYHDIDLNEPDGLELESVGLAIAPDPDGWGLKIVDRATGRRLLTLEEGLLTLEEERVARETAEKRAEQEARRAEQEARRAEQEARRAEEEARARQAAERQAAEEARARKILEQELARVKSELQRRSD